MDATALVRNVIVLGLVVASSTMIGRMTSDRVTAQTRDALESCRRSGERLQRLELGMDEGSRRIDHVIEGLRSEADLSPTIRELGVLSDELFLLSGRGLSRRPVVRIKR